jgi:hypothetical protein
MTRGGQNVKTLRFPGVAGPAASDFVTGTAIPVDGGFSVMG